MRNIDCSDVIQIFGPFFRPIVGQESTCTFPFCGHKLFGKEMMLLPWLNTMPGSSRSSVCHVGICNELLKFLSVQLSSAWTYLKSSLNVRVATLTLYFVSSLLNFM